MRTPLLIFLLAAAGIMGTLRPACVSAQPTPASAQTPESAIHRLMTDQTAAWTRGNIDEFMKGYWNSDSLRTSSERRS